jgi:hypothetical protein
MTRMLVCGGRMYGLLPRDTLPHEEARERARVDRQVAHLNARLDEIHDTRGVSLLIHGDAMGADKLAMWWARRRRVPVLGFPISRDEWARWGGSAGPIRNERMLVEGKPDLVVVFNGERGTEDMMQRALAAGIEVVRAAL